MVDARTLKTEIESALAGAEGARVKADVIFETVAGRRFSDFTGEISESDAATARELAGRVAAGYPVQYVAGAWPFMDFEVQIGEGVLIPRDDSVCVAEAAIGFVSNGCRALDLCAGSGILGIALARAGANVTSVEKYDAAFEYLKVNASRLAPQMRIMQADVFGYETGMTGCTFDIIVCNPPYLTAGEYDSAPRELSFEPKEALVGGLDFYKYIIKNYKRLLVPGGALVFEIGASQGGDVQRLLTEGGFTGVQVTKDLNGLDRAAVGRVEKNCEICYHQNINKDSGGNADGCTDR